MLNSFLAILQSKWRRDPLIFKVSHFYVYFEVKMQVTELI